MINYNGVISDANQPLSVFNRSFQYGDGIFETLKVANAKVLFLEDHYFRLLASMRIVRMQIPMSFTLEYLEKQILDLVNQLQIQNAARVRMTVFRNEGGFYTPTDNSVSFIITVEAIENSVYAFPKATFEVDLYKDFALSAQLLSTLKTTSKIINVTAGVFAQENGLDSCLLINTEKNVVEATNGNLFMLINNQLITPPLSEGALNGVMRKQILQLAKQFETVEVVEKIISPFDLQKADELFITNVIMGIQPVTKYRKKEYGVAFATKVLEKINEVIEA